MAISVNVPLATNQIISDYASMNANWEYVVLGDGTAGQVLRYSRLNIAYNAGVFTVQVYLLSKWNGDSIDSSGTPHVITEGDDDTNWFLDGRGWKLSIKAAGLTGNAVAAYAVISYNKTGSSNILVSAEIVSNDIVLSFYTGSAGATYPPSDLASGESLEVDILYLTSA